MKKNKEGKGSENFYCVFHQSSFKSMYVSTDNEVLCISLSAPYQLSEFKDIYIYRKRERKEDKKYCNTYKTQERLIQ